MPTHRNLRCTVHTKFGPLQEYQGDVDDKLPPFSAPTVYIEAQDGEPFWVCYEALPDYRFTVGDSVSFGEIIDGIPAPTSTSVTERNIIQQSKGFYNSDGSGKTFLQPYEFLVLSLDDGNESDIHTDKVSLEKSGEIVVFAMRRQSLGVSKVLKIKATAQTSSLGKFREKELKGRDLTHVTKLGPAKTVNETIVDTKNLDVGEPYARFRFLYRSKRILQNLGLIPHTPSPSPPPASVNTSDPGEGSRVVEEMPPEVAQEIARVRALLESLESKYKVKREIKEEDNPQPKRAKISKGKVKTEVIDLTIDD